MEGPRPSATHRGSLSYPLTPVTPVTPTTATPSDNQHFGLGLPLHHGHPRWVSQSGTADYHDFSHPKPTPWTNELCHEPDGDLRTCCVGFWLPGALYGKTQHRLKQMAEGEDPLDESRHEFCNGPCWMYELVMWCSRFDWFIVMLQHSRIRATYNIDGTTGGDCVQSFFCARCTLMQDDREVRSRERKIASERGQTEVRKQPGPQPQMRYSTSNLLEEIPDIFRPVAANPEVSTPQLSGTQEAQASEPLLPGVDVVDVQEQPRDSNPSSTLHCESLPSKQGPLKSHLRTSSLVGSALNPIPRSSSISFGGREKVRNMPQRCATSPVRLNSTIPPFPSYESGAKTVEEAPERLSKFNIIRKRAKSDNTNPSISSNAGIKSLALGSIGESILVYYDPEDEPQRRRLSDCSRLRAPTPETPDIYGPRSLDGTVEEGSGASGGASLVKLHLIQAERLGNGSNTQYVCKKESVYQVHNAGIMKSLINKNAVETAFQLSSTPQCIDSVAALSLTNGTVNIVPALCMQNTNASSLDSTVEGMAALDAATEIINHGKSQGMDIISTHVFVKGMNGNNADNCGEVYTTGEDSISHGLDECCSKSSAATYRGDGDGEDSERLRGADGDQQRIPRPAHAFQEADQVCLASAESATANAEELELNMKNFTSALPHSLERAQQPGTESAKIDNANGYSASTLAMIDGANDYSLVVLKALPTKLETPSNTNPLLDQLAKNPEQDHAIEDAQVKNSDSCKMSTSALALQECDVSSMEGVTKPLSQTFSGKSSSVIDFAHINPKNVVDDLTKSGYSDLIPKSFQSDVLNVQSGQSARDQDLVSEDCDYFSAEQHMTDDSNVSPERTDNFTVVPLALKTSHNAPVIECDELRLVCDRINSHQISYESTSSESTVGPLTPPLTTNKVHSQKRVVSPAETILRTVLGIPSKYAVSEVGHPGAGSQKPVKDESPKSIKLGGRRSRHRRGRKRQAAEAGTKMKKENSNAGMSLARS